MLANGLIPKPIVSNCIANALQQASRTANEAGLAQQAIQIWNPLTAALLKDSTPQLPSTSKNKDKHSAEKSSFVKNQLKKGPDTVSKSSTPVDVTRIHNALKQNIPTYGLYSNKFHSHISCVKPNCQFCTDMYLNINISRCEGHPQCHSSGYYPHVGKVLWKMIRGRHDREVQCTLKAKGCKDGELPSLNDKAQADHDATTSPLRMNWAETPPEVEFIQPMSPIYRPQPRAATKRAADSPHPIDDEY